MEQVLIQFSPAFQALPFAMLIQLQMLTWLRQDFNCTSFKIVNEDADVYIFMANEGKQRCGNLNYGQYLGCFYFDGRMYLNEGLFGFGHDWHYAYKYRRDVLRHEMEHYFLPSHVHQGNESELYRKLYC